MEKKNGHQNNEKMLFHGTREDSINHINHSGFNRSYAGLNGMGSVLVFALSYVGNFTNLYVNSLQLQPMEKAHTLHLMQATLPATHIQYQMHKDTNACITAEFSLETMHLETVP